MDRSKLIQKLEKIQGVGTRKELTRQQLAERLKISQSYMSDIFNGKREPGPALLKKMGLRREVTYVEARG